MKNFSEIAVFKEQYVWKSGIYHLPKTNPLPDGRFPLLYFNCGKVKPNPSDLLIEGVPKKVEDLGDVWGFMLDGRKVNFAVIALTDAFWSPDKSWFNPAVDWALKDGHIHPDYIFATGLSAGGSVCLDLMLDAAIGNRLQAAVPMSINGVDQNPANWAPVLKNHVESWFVCGELDGDYRTFTTIAQTMASKVYPLSSKLEVVPGQGHSDGTWGAASDPTRTNSIYSWFLSEGLPVAPDPLPPPQPTLLTTIEVYTDATIKQV